MIIRTWRERCNDFPDGHITTTRDIERVMQDEIDDLRAALDAVAARMDKAAFKLVDIESFGLLK